MRLLTEFELTVVQEVGSNRVCCSDGKAKADLEVPPFYFKKENVVFVSCMSHLSLKKFLITMGRSTTQ